MVRKKCLCCEKETSRHLHEFAEIGWRAVSFDGKKSICACPKHGKEHHDYMIKECNKHSLSTEKLEEKHG